MESRTRPYRRGIVAVAIAGAIVLALSTTFAATAPPLTRLSTDPFTNPTAEH